MMQPHTAVAQNRGAAEQHRGRTKKKKIHPVPVTVHPQPGGVSARPKPWQHFTPMRELSLPSMQPARRVKVKRWVLTQHHVLEGVGGGWGGSWKTSDTMQRENKPSPATSHLASPGFFFDEVCSSEIAGHISFEQIELKR